MICVFDVTAGPARGKRFWIHSEQTFEIGRISTADFAVPTDAHMSRHHLVLEGKVSTFQLRDVGSANGTFVNDARVRSVELADGDEVRAGETVFSVSLLQDDDNPHSRDGFTFGSVEVDEIPTRSVVLFDDDVTARVQHDDDDRTQFHEIDQFSLDDLWSNLKLKREDKPNWYVQKSEGIAAGDGFLIASMINAAQSKFQLCAIVNLGLLNRVARTQVSQLASAGRVVWFTPTLCSVNDDGKDSFKQLARNSVSDDAFLLLGSESPISSDELSELAEHFNQPSALLNALNDEDEKVEERLLQNFDFAAFNDPSSGEINVLIGLGE